MKNPIKSVYHFSLSSLARWFRKRYWPRRINPPDVSFVRSVEYEATMNTYVPCTGDYGLHEAATHTRSYHYRHHDCESRLGVWRWRSMQEYRDTILAHLADPKKTVVDFGGAGCPLGMNSIVVDRQKKDAAGRSVRFSRISQLTQPIDTVFACHVLEHVSDLKDVLLEIRQALKPNGVLIAIVPAFTNKGWRAGIHRNRRFTEHKWTFGLRGTPVQEDLGEYCEIDDLLAKYFKVEQAAYCGDDNIFCLCSNSGSDA